MKQQTSAFPDDERPKPIDNQKGMPELAPRRIDLSSLRDVRLELAAVYRKMDSGEIASQDGTRRAYILKTIHDVIVSAELERRISELEEQRGQVINHAALNAAISTRRPQ